MPQDKRIGKIKKLKDHRVDVEEKTGMDKWRKWGGRKWKREDKRNKKGEEDGKAEKKRVLYVCVCVCACVRACVRVRGERGLSLLAPLALKDLETSLSTAAEGSLQPPTYQRTLTPDTLLETESTLSTACGLRGD